MQKFDREGVFKCEIVEHTISQTKNKGLPQFVARVKALEMFIGDSDEFEAYGLTEPGWVDLSKFENLDDMGGMLYLVLFKENGEPIFHYEALQNAIGWDGGSFQSLASMDLSNTQVLVEVRENEWDGKVTIRPEIIASVNDDPTSIGGGGPLKALDDTALADLQAKFGASMVTAKPAAKPKAASKPKSKSKSAPKTKAPAKTAPKSGPPPVKADVASPPALPDFADTNSAWAYLVEQRGDVDEDALGEAWMTVGDSLNKSDTDFDGDDLKTLVTGVAEKLGITLS